MAEAMIAELEREAAPTRHVLERVPEGELSWRPHPKSMSLGELAYHVAVLPRAIADLVSESPREIPKVPRPEATSVGELLSLLDEGVPYAREKLEAWGDDGLRAPWTMTRGGATLLEMPRVGMIRSVMLNHWYHHRGQLTVYLRLLDVPVPSVYGGSADEPMF